MRSSIMYGSALNKKQDNKIKGTEMQILRWMDGVTESNKIRNEYTNIKGYLEVTNVNGKLRGK